MLLLEQVTALGLQFFWMCYTLSQYGFVLAKYTIFVRKDPRGIE